MKTLCIGIVCLRIMVLVKCEINLAYDKKVGISFSGLCLNNCEDGECAVNTMHNIEKCTDTLEDAPVFDIIKNKENCLSRCVIESSYSWCYTDNDGNWDYCNPNKTVEWVRGQKFTEKNGPCKDECKYHCESDRCGHRCNHYWGGWDYCDPKLSYSYIQSQTYGKEFCRNKCKDHDHTGIKWCYYGDNRHWDYCGLPALPRTRDWGVVFEQIIANRMSFNMSVSASTDQLCTQTQQCVEGNNLENKYSLIINNLDNLTKYLEEDQQYNYVYINSENRHPDEPIYSWTIETGDASKEIPYIPRVVRAEVLPRHVKHISGHSSIPIDVHCNLDLLGKRIHDHAGHLIPVSLSGPTTIYNIVPRMNTHNEDGYAFPENAIRKFLHTYKEDGKVDVLVIPLYAKGETRPAGISMRVGYYRGKTLVNVYFEYVPNLII